VKTIKIKINKQIKKQEKLLKENLRKTRAVRVKLIKEMKEEPLLKEAQKGLLQELNTLNEKSNVIYAFDNGQIAERNFDELHNDLVSEKVTYDQFYETLNRSFAYERGLYFNEGEENINEIFGLSSQEKLNKAMANVERGEDPETADRRGVLQKVKDAASNWLEDWKKTWNKGALIFTLKVVETGLKLALKAVQGIRSIITNFIKRIIMNIIKEAIAAKTSGLQILNSIKEKGSGWAAAAMNKIMAPFKWMANQLTSNKEKAAEIAPLLMSITFLSLTLAITLAFMYASAAAEATKGAAEGLGAVASGGGEAASFICGAAAAAAVSEGLLKEDEECQQALLANGQTLSNAQLKALVDKAIADVNAGGATAGGISIMKKVQAVTTDLPAQAAKEVGELSNIIGQDDVGEFITTQITSDGELVRITDVLTSAADDATVAGQLLDAAQGIPFGEDIDLSQASQNLQAYVMKSLEATKSAAEKIGSVSDDSMTDYLNRVVTSVETVGGTVIEKTVEAVQVNGEISEEVKEAAVTFTKSVMRSAAVVDAPITEQLKRMKELSGIL